MNTGPFQKGDRVDYRGYHDGEVLRVGRSTVWALFVTPHGNFPVAAPAGDFRRHVPPTVLRIGEYGVRASGSNESKVQIHSTRTGEMMETDTAKFESMIARFWRREF